MFTSIINKEDICALSFPKNDVITDSILKHARLERLKTALILGNGFKHKVKIIFQADNGHKVMVNTTIWFVSDTHVSLKGGIIIPIRSIEEVIFS
ncbi:MAG: hypothetical protein JSU07_06890 [Bacteroidetes bacterium]|nr:hypothetical protein [Bacteroidota bacterium]